MMTTLPAGKYRVIEVKIAPGHELDFCHPFVVLRTRFLSRPSEIILDVLIQDGGNEDGEGKRSSENDSWGH